MRDVSTATTADRNVVNRYRKSTVPKRPSSLELPWAKALATSTNTRIGATAFNEYVVPRANNAYNRIINEEIKHNVAPTTQDHIIIKNTDGSDISSLMYARQYDATSRELKDITVQEFENDQLMRVEQADRADWNGQKWIMHEGTIFDVSTDERTTRSMKFQNQALPVTQKPDKIASSQKKPEELTIRELREQIKLLDQIPSIPIR